MVTGLKVSLFSQIFLVISPGCCIYEGGTWFLLHVDAKIVAAPYMCAWVCVCLYVRAYVCVCNQWSMWTFDISRCAGFVGDITVLQ